MGCGICAKLSRKEKDVVKVYKDFYETYGKVYYAYRTETDGVIRFVVGSSFNTVFERDIKPNFDKGAEFFHIKEFSR
jgi:hypothetical protein